MKRPVTLADILDGHVVLDVDCLDRIYLNVIWSPPCVCRARRFADAAASDETYQELLARTLTIVQDTAMRDKRKH